MRTMSLGRSAVFLLLAFVVFYSAARAEEPTDKVAAANEKVSYFRQIRPLFQAHCQGCHQPAKPQGEYVMTDFKRLLAGGESEEPAVVPFKPGESSLVEQLIPEGGEAEMPKEKDPLSKGQIELVTRWVAEGAVDDTPESAKVRYDAKHPPVYMLPPVITSLDFSPDGKLLAVAGFHEVLLHKADGSGLVARLIGMSERIESVRFSPDGKLLAVTGGLPARMGEVQVWDVAKRQLKLSHSVTFDSIHGANWSPDGKLISFGCADNTVRVIEAKTGKEVFYQGAHSDLVLDTVFSEKGTHLISVGRDRSVKLNELATQRFVDNITSITPGALKGGVAAVDRHPTKDEILVGGVDGEPKLYRVFRTSKRVIGDDANLIRRFPPLKGRIFDVAISRDGKRIVAGSCLDRTGEVRVYAYEFDTGLPKDLLAIMKKRSYQRSPQEQAKLAEYRTQGVKVLAETAIPKAGIFAVAFSADGKTVAAAGTDGLVRLIDAESGSITKQFVPVPVSSMMNVASKTGDPATMQMPPHRSKVEKPSGPPETLPKEEKLVALEVQPVHHKIDHVFDTVQFIVTARMASGHVEDVTRQVKIDVIGSAIDVSSSGLVSAKVNGRSEVTFSLGDKTAKATIEVVGMTPTYDVDFVRDVMPVFAKAGCNAGTCHGSKKGKGGLRTSLRGNDPVYELRALFDELSARRINLASPENSLLLLKATAGVPHEGGQNVQPDSAYYRIIHRWISDGAKIDTATPRVASIDISPKNRILQRTVGRQQYRVMATYTDGTTRDVTAEAHISSGDIEVATADETGLLSVLRRGEAPVLARFEGRYAATTLTVMGDRTGFVWKDPPRNNFIDELVAVKLKRTKTMASELCTDAEFIRRVYLDVTGLPPTVDGVRKFLADQRDTRLKRDELIDRLVGSGEYVEHWTNKWADLLQVNRKYLGAEGAAAFRKWIRQQVADNVPYDRFTYSLLTASGSNRENPAASYFKIHRTPDDAMQNTMHLFLAVRFSCNKCHDHPFEGWVQNQYWETAAYFARVGLKKDPVSGKRQIGKTAVEAGKPLYEIVFDKPDGEVLHDETGQVTPPKFPFPAEYHAPKDASRREHMARWITSPDNRYFAKSYVNRVWGYMLGIAFIEPLDDIRAGNPPTNPELLDRLTREFVDGGFNVRHLIRTICKSRTYQMSIVSNKWNEDDRINYSRAMARRLPAEVLYDTLHRATGSISKLPGVPPGTRAAELPDIGVKEPSGFLAKFGRPPRESACECERAGGMQFGPVMALVSGPMVDGVINDPDNEITKLVAREKDDARLVDEMFMRILNRPATDAEKKVGVAAIASLPAEHARLVAEMKKAEQSLKADDPKMQRLRGDVELSAKQLKNARLTAAQDIAWALINSPAFLFNR